MTQDEIAKRILETFGMPQASHVFEAEDGILSAIGTDISVLFAVAKDESLDPDVRGVAARLFTTAYFVQVHQYGNMLVELFKSPEVLVRFGVLEGTGATTEVEP